MAIFQIGCAYGHQVHIWYNKLCQIPVPSTSIVSCFSKRFACFDQEELLSNHSIVTMTFINRFAKDPILSAVVSWSVYPGDVTFSGQRPCMTFPVIIVVTLMVAPMPSGWVAWCQCCCHVVSIMSGFTFLAWTMIYIWYKWISGVNWNVGEFGGGTNCDHGVTYFIKKWGRPQSTFQGVAQ